MGFLGEVISRLRAAGFFAKVFASLIVILFVGVMTDDIDSWSDAKLMFMVIVKSYFSVFEALIHGDPR